MSCHLRAWRGGSCGQNKSNDWTDNMNEQQAKKLFDEFYEREKRSRIELGQPLQEVMQGPKAIVAGALLGPSSPRS